jgi:serpin B
MRTTIAPRAAATAMVVALGLAPGCAPADDGGPPTTDADPATARGDFARVAAAAEDVVAPDAEEAALEVADGFDDFGLALLAELHDPDAEANTALSGLSAGVALSMVLAGAEGETAEEIATALGIEQDAPADGSVSALLASLTGAGDVDLTLANAVWTWPDYPLTEAFRTTITGRLGASLDGLDFADPAAVAAIDRWAADRTDGLVEEITDSLDGVPGEQAVMVLANATHFAGDWLQPFDPDETAPGPFTRDDGETVEAELMHQDAAEVAVVVDADRGLLLARLPYGAADGGEEVDPARRGSASRRGPRSATSSR